MSRRKTSHPAAERLKEAEALLRRWSRSADGRDETYGLAGETRDFLASAQPAPNEAAPRRTSLTKLP